MKHAIHAIPSGRIPPSALLALLATSLVASAATVTWSGAGDRSSWGDTANWNGGAVPTAADDVVIPGGNLPSDKIIHLGADRAVKSLVFNGANTAILDGDGAYTLTVAAGSITGQNNQNVKAQLRCGVVFGANASAHAAQYGANIQFLKGFSDNGAGYSFTADGDTSSGYQNSAVLVNGDVDIGGALVVESSAFVLGGAYVDSDGTTVSDGGRIVSASEIAIDSSNISTANGLSTWATLRLNNLDGIRADRVPTTVPVRIVGNGGHVNIVGNADAAMSERLGSVSLEGGFGMLRIGNNPSSKGGQVALTVDTFTRSEATILETRTDKNSTIAIAGAANAGPIWKPWAFSGEYWLKVDGSGNLVSTANGDYAVLNTTSGGDATRLYRIDDTEATLEADTSVHALLSRHNGGQILHLSKYDLYVDSGAISMKGSGDKLIDSDGGALVFGGEEIIWNSDATSTGGTWNDNALTVSAPIAWRKPDGSAVLRPNLLLAKAAHGSTGTSFTGEDRIGDYGTLLVRSIASSAVRTVTFGGPSDRTFHGPMRGIAAIAKTGTGTLSFLGPAEGRILSLDVREGRVVLGNENAPGTTVRTGAELQLNAVVARANRSSVPVTAESGAVISGTGGILANQIGGTKLPSGCIIRPGTDTAAGTLQIGGQYSPPSGTIFDIRFDATTNGCVNAAYQLVFPSENGAVTIRIEDLTHGQRVIREADSFPILLSGSNAINTPLPSATFENLSPRWLDTANASIVLSPDRKTVFLSGVKSLGSPTVILFR